MTGSEMKKLKLTYPNLALMDWLMEDPANRMFIRSTGMHQHDIELIETRPSEKHPGKLKTAHVNTSGQAGYMELKVRLGGRFLFDTHALYQNRLVNSYAGLPERERWMEFQSRFESDFHYSDHVYVPNKNMVSYWRTYGRQQFEEARAKRAEQRAEVERLVIVGGLETITPAVPRELGAKLPDGITFPHRSARVIRPQAIAKVIKETSSRLYLDEIDNGSRSVRYGDNVLSGSAPNIYVDRNNVLYDHATPEMFEKLSAIDAEFEEDLSRIARQAWEDMLPSLIDMNSRFLQKEAEREDMIREALELGGDGPSGGRKP